MKRGVWVGEWKRNGRRVGWGVGVERGESGWGSGREIGAGGRSGREGVWKGE